MRKHINLLIPLCLAAAPSFFNSCSSAPTAGSFQKKIAGKYASISENNYDHFKDTLEIKPTDDGKYDITMLAQWSAAKENDPERPVNKVAGVWRNAGKGKTRVAELQLSDTTLRIVDPLGGNVVSLHVDVDAGTLEWPNKYVDEPPVFKKFE